MEEVTAIGVYLEGLPDVPAFAEAAARALERGVPIAVCKAGRSELGKQLAYTHTAALAGEDGLYDTFFERYGVVRAATLPQLLETLKALTAFGSLRGRRARVFTCSGAESALAADAAAAAGLDLPQPSADVRPALVETLPEHALVANPLDYGNALWGAEEPLRRVFGTALRDPVDVALLVIDYPRPGVAYAADVDAAVRALADAARAAGVPAAVASVLPESFPAGAREAATALGVCPLQGLDDAFSALGACARLGARLASGTPPAYPPVEPLRGEAVPLGEWDAKELVRQAGIAVPAGRLVPPQQAAQAGAEVGFPVAVKLVSPELPHKAAAGALALDVRDGVELEDVVAAVLERHPGVSFDGVLVERMVVGGRCELLVGLRRDASFGVVVAVGSGGSLVELVDDVVPLLLPLAREDVEAALARLRVWPRLRTADVEAAIDAVLAVARLVDEHPGLVELELNPLVVLERGAVALDALGRVARG
jgi:acyl-CoA synthetase (NDP forming)